MRNALTAVLANSFLINLGFSIGGIMQPLAAQQINLQPEEIGFLLLIANATSAVLRIPVGIAGDLMGRKWLILGASASSAVATAILPLMPSFPVFVLHMVIWGISQGLYFTSNTTLIAELSEPSQVVSAYSKNSIAWMTANMIGPLTSGLLADALGVFYPFYFATLTLLLSCLPCALIPLRKRGKENPVTLRQVLNGKTKAVLFAFSATYLLHGVGMGMLWPITPIFYKSVDLTYSVIGLINTSTQIGGMLGSVLIIKFLGGRDKRKLITASSIAYMTIISAYPLVGSEYLYFPLSFASGLVATLTAMSPVASSLFATHIPIEILGISNGVLGTFWRIGLSAGSYSLGVIWSNLGIPMVFYSTAAILLAESILISRTFPGEKQQDKTRS